MEAAWAEGHSPAGAPCTLAVLGFQEEQDLAGNSLSRRISSFLGAEGESGRDRPAADLPQGRGPVAGR